MHIFRLTIGALFSIGGLVLIVAAAATYQAKEAAAQTAGTSYSATWTPVKCRTAKYQVFPEIQIGPAEWKVTYTGNGRTVEETWAPSFWNDNTRQPSLQDENSQGGNDPVVSYNTRTNCHLIPFSRGGGSNRVSASGYYGFVHSGYFGTTSFSSMPGNWQVSGQVR